MFAPDLIEQLKSKYEATGPEKVGVIIDDEVVELDNHHPHSSNFFIVSLEDQEAYLANAQAVWHTQPGKTSQLSYEDYLGFLNFPNLKHIVIGLDGLRIYKVEDGQVLKDSVSLRYSERTHRS